MKILDKKVVGDLLRAVIELKGFHNLEEQKEEYGVAKFVVSGEKRDRHGTIVKQAGMDWSHWKKAPVILADHFYTTDNIVGKGIKLEQGVDETSIELVWAPNEKAQVLRRLYDEGFPLMTSIGFIPKKFDEADDTIITESEILEVTITPVGSYRDAIKKELDEEFVKRCVELDIFKKDAEPTEPADDEKDDESDENNEPKDEPKENPVEELKEAVEELKADMSSIKKMVAGLMERTVDEEDEDLDGIVRLFQDADKKQSEAMRRLKEIRNKK